jgi:mRNA interferase MazF
MTLLTRLVGPIFVSAMDYAVTVSIATKKRPALVISSEHYQRETRHISLLMVTTSKHSQWDGDHQIIDLEAAGLSTPSIIRQKLFTIDRRLVQKQIGLLGKVDKKNVIQLLKQHLCLL